MCQNLILRLFFHIRIKYGIIGSVFFIKKMHQLESKLGLFQEKERKKIQDALKLIEPYNFSAVKVLQIMIPLNPDADTVIALLLNEYYSSGMISTDKLIAGFGLPVLNIIRGVDSLNNLNFSQNDKALQLEGLRKMFLAMAKDLRVVFITLSFRLYKMKFVVGLFGEGARKLYAQETMKLYVPIAERLGMYRFKTDLEDLSFKYLDPEKYEELDQELNSIKSKCNASIKSIKKTLEDFFHERGVKAGVFGRIKSIYSIYHKLQRKNLNNVADLYDIFAIRILLPAKVDGENHDIDEMYTILGMLHSEWKPLSSKFKDYVTVPKPNGYQSLHTVLLGLLPEDPDQPVEVQIRDTVMHRDAEYGIASHWIYKTNHKSPLMEAAGHAKWLKGLEKLRDDFEKEEDMLRQVEIDIFKDRIFVLTPMGEVKDLPIGAVPIDFAYKVHSDIGNTCVMAKVDGELVSLDYKLKNGQVVEILTRKDARPKLQWLSFVKTGLAENKIKTYFSSLNKEKYLKEGKKLINTFLERVNKPKLDQNYSIFKKYLGKRMTVQDRERLIQEVGKGGKMAGDVVRKAYPNEKLIIPSTNVPDFSRKGSLLIKKPEDQILIAGEDGLPIKLAACCHPRAGDSVIGYVTRGNRISIHRKNCKMLGTLDIRRFIEANWRESEILVRDLKQGLKKPVR